MFSNFPATLHIRGGIKNDLNSIFYIIFGILSLDGQTYNKNLFKTHYIV